jgi:hypothetical protein
MWVDCLVLVAFAGFALWAVLTLRGLQKQLTANEELVGRALEALTNRLEALRTAPAGTIALHTLFGVLEGVSLGMPDTALSAWLAKSGAPATWSLGTDGVVSLTRPLHGFRPGAWESVFQVQGGRLQQVSLFCREGPEDTRAELERWLREKFGTPRAIADETEGLPEDVRQFLQDENHLFWVVPLHASAGVQVGLRGAKGDASLFAQLTAAAAR